MPSFVLSKLGLSFGKASRSSLLNSIPQLSTKALGAADPIRAMMRSQRIFCSPSRVSRTSEPGSTFEGEVSVITLRSEEHTSELQSLMRISYAVFCLKKKIKPNISIIIITVLQIHDRQKSSHQKYSATHR